MKIIMRFVIIGILTIAIVGLLTNCASIIHGTRQNVTVNSTPTQADLVIKTEGGVIVHQGQTPATVTLERKNSYDVTISLEGYQETKIRINKEFDATYLGNLICGGVIGLIIDAVNGAMYKLEPAMIQAELVTASLKDGSEEIYVVFRVSNDEGQLQTMVIPLIKS